MKCSRLQKKKKKNKGNLFLFKSLQKSKENKQLVINCFSLQTHGH